jgi:hypothetical protein
MNPDGSYAPSSQGQPPPPSQAQPPERPSYAPAPSGKIKEFDAEIIRTSERRAATGKMRYGICVKLGGGDRWVNHFAEHTHKLAKTLVNTGIKANFKITENSYGMDLVELSERAR